MDATVRLWNTETGAQIRAIPPPEELRFHFLPLWTVAFSPNDALIATGGSDGSTRLWEPKTGRLVAVLADDQGSVLTVAFGPDGRRVVTAGEKEAAEVWNASGRDRIALLQGHEGSVNDADFSPDGERVAIAGDDGTLRIWDARTDTLIAGYGRGDGPALSVEFDRTADLSSARSTTARPGCSAARFADQSARRRDWQGSGPRAH
jgi:WD40 repeat protein